MKKLTFNLFLILSCCMLASCSSTKPAATAAPVAEADETLNSCYRFQEAEKLFDEGVGASNEALLQDAMKAYWIFICRNIPLDKDGVEIKSEKDLLEINDDDNPKVKSAKEKFLLCKKILAEKFNRKVDFKINPVMIRHLAE